MLALFIVLTVLFGAVTYFLASEFLKKFGFMANFVNDSNQMVRFHYSGAVNSRSTGMRNIVLRGDKPFCALIGFRLNIPVLEYSGFDYYGFVQSDAQGVAVISTYFGRGPCEFQFFVNTDLDTNEIISSSSNTDQMLPAQRSFPPHWYQRLGFYG